MHRSRDNIAAFLEGVASNGASAEAVATLVTETLQGIGQALVPIVGRRGMAALYQRSLRLSRSTHAWLPAADEGTEAEFALTALKAALTRQTPADAAAAGTQLLANFHALLITLIGESLTERLLRPVWVTLLSGPSARDTNS